MHGQSAWLHAARRAPSSSMLGSATSTWQHCARWHGSNWFEGYRRSSQWTNCVRHASPASKSGRRSRTRRSGGRSATWSWSMAIFVDRWHQQLQAATTTFCYSSMTGAVSCRHSCCRPRIEQLKLPRTSKHVWRRVQIEGTPHGPWWVVHSDRIRGVLCC